MENPKLLISYSWSNPTHEQWVLDLATELRDSGVDVVLDKWDLKKGHDSVKFMEKMVTDPTIEKVVIVSDEIYANKADGREGGVGTETQIISKEVYDNQEQDKFVAVVAQKDEKGKPYLPTYYKSRIYIDLSEPDNYAENFETLLRWIYGKPLHVKPALGRRPLFLGDSEGISLGTTAAFKRVISAIKDNKPFASGALDEYLSIFLENLEKFRIKNVVDEFDDAVIKNIEQFMPYRNEAINLFFTIAQYSPTQENISKLHRFFESLISYNNRPENMQSWKNWDFDNFKFIVHELFLYALAILLKTEKFEQANIFISEQYYFADDSNNGQNAMLGFNVFREYLQSFEHRNKRLKLNRLSLHSDILEQRSKSSGLDFRYLMQADFVLFMRADIDQAETYSRWYPDTLLCLGHFHSAFEIFSRSVSKKYFDRIKCILNISQPSDLNKLLEAYKSGKQTVPSWQIQSFSPATLLGYEQLATKV